ncbi:putative SUR7/PalI family protein [Lyophyllum shimeji]|uniref:SUR7/PalI family protein n=1 Tax=Lyophyllum shimeji TaxID=47721 RepID=A0A9P3PJB3_LYOSH|nr:putative SUR7/PalI family protein [Lyophyllum shimeji]
MRGEVCVGTATVLSLVSMILMVFVHVGQINTSVVPRKISMARVNVSEYSAALQISFADPFDDIYTNNASAPLGVKAGLRQFYEFGLYSHCAYVNSSHGMCGNLTVGQQYRPYDAIASDMAANFSLITAALVSGTTFEDSHYLGQATQAAYWMLLLGTICAALALLTGILKNNLTFFVSTLFSIAGSLLLLIGVSIWTVMIKKSEGVNDITVGTQSNPWPLGIVVSTGSGLYMTWAAFVCLVVSVVPYMISCCTYRG